MSSFRLVGVPAPITTESELEDLLSRPTAVSVAAMREMVGDLLILGAGGKMGPSLARLARRSADEAGRRERRVIAVSRFSTPGLREELQRDRIETVACDLLDEAARRRLPEAANVVLMTGVKFGAGDRPDLLWAMNAYLPGLLAEQYRRSRIVAFSTGNVYPFWNVDEPGPTEDVPPAPVGEYAITTLGRERVLQYASREHGTPVCILRLNYAVELRYGVPVDIGLALLAGEPIDVTTAHVNVVWQGYANAVALGSFALARSPAAVLNVAGPKVAVRDLAERLGRRLGVEPKFTGTESGTALLSDASRCRALFGEPEVGVEEMLDLIAGWLKRGGRTLGKPTKFQVRDGRF